MKKLLLLLSVILLFACNSESTLFEKETWWEGHWQKIDEPTFFFSSGQKRIGFNEIVTSNFFFSTSDTILQNFHLTELVEFDHNDGYKIIETSDNTFIKIQEIDEDHIELHGPASSIADLDGVINDYRRLPDNVEPPFPDSILYER